MKKLHLDELRQRLRWQEIVKEERLLEVAGESPALPGQADRFGVFRVIPSNPAWPDVRLVCDPDFQSLEQIEFSAWDGYDVDGYARDLRGAVGLVADLVKREICVVEELDSAGRCLTASLLGPDEVPDLLYKSTQELRRVIFDREPRHEEIDRGRYVGWGNKLIERGWAKIMELPVEEMEIGPA